MDSDSYASKVNEVGRDPSLEKTQHSISIEAIETWI
jgi:hypothetical protein